MHMITYWSDLHRNNNLSVHYSRRKKWFRYYSSFEKKKSRFLFCLATYKLIYFDFPKIIPTLQGSFNYWESKGQASGLINLALPIFFVVVKWDNMHTCGRSCGLGSIFNSLSLPKAATEERKWGGAVHRQTMKNLRKWETMTRWQNVL